MMFLLAATVAAATPIAPPECREIAGAVPTIGDSETRWIVIGELHGTDETPAAFGELACQLANDAPLAVAVEQADVNQYAIDRFMTSDGGELAIAEFRTARMWRSDDGRGSLAYFALFERLRQLHAAGRVTAVIAFVPSRLPTDTISGPGWYDRAMAERLAALSPASGRIIVLVGNIHARRTAVTIGGVSYLPMASILPQRETRAINARGDGGSAWVCLGADQCGPNTFPLREHEPRRVQMGLEAEDGFDGVLFLGTPTTASPPLRP